MFPSMWSTGGVAYMKDKMLLRIDVSTSPIIIKTDQSIPSREILKFKFPRRISEDEEFSPNAEVRAFPHIGVSIDPNTGVPIHPSSTASAKFEKIDNDIHQIYLDSGTSAVESWEYEVYNSITSPIYYWEIEILSTVNSDNDTSGVAMGLVPAYDNSSTLTSFPDIANSIAYSSSGLRIEHGEIKRLGTGFGTRDVVGCGWEIGGRGRVFFTCNGRVVSRPAIGYGAQGQSYCPAVELVGMGTAVRTNLGSDDFQFDTKDLLIANKVMIKYDPPASTSVESVWTGILKGFTGSSRSMSMTAVDADKTAGLEGGLSERNSLTGVTGKQVPAVSSSAAPIRPVLSQSLSDNVATVWSGSRRETPQPLTPLTDRHIQHDHVDRINTGWTPQHTRYDYDDELLAIASAISQSRALAGGEGMSEGELHGVDMEPWSQRDTASTREALLLIQGILESANADAVRVKEEKSAEQKQKVSNSQSSCSYNAENVGEVLASVTSTLGRLQQKMLATISATPEDSTLDTLLHLNDVVSFTLNSAVEYLTSHGIAQYNMFLGPPQVLDGTSSEDPSTSTSIPEADRITQGRSGDSLTPQELPSVVSILYMLRRGSHEEMALAVTHLLAMCGHGSGVGSAKALGQKQQDAINDLRSAGGLQTLVSAIGRCSDWPSLELQISTAIAVMVANESDWHLLVKDVHAILSSLHMLLLKSSYVNAHDEDVGRWVGSSQSLDTITNNQQLVAAAVSRLCLVLCAEWGKPVNQSGHGWNEFGFSNVPSPDTEQSSSVLDIHRKLSSTGAAAHSGATKASSDKEANLSRMLKALMHILRLLSPPSSASSYSSVEHVLSPRVAAAQRLPGGLLGNRALSNELNTVRGRSSSYASAIPLLETQGTSTRLNTSLDGVDDHTDNTALISPRQVSMHRSLSESSAMNAKGNRVPAPLDVAFLPGDDGDIASATFLNSVNSIDGEPPVDDTVVLCSVALSNLAQIESFRAALVADGALSMLTQWLDVATAVLSWHNAARLKASAAAVDTVDLSSSSTDHIDSCSETDQTKKKVGWNVEGNTDGGSRLQLSDSNFLLKVDRVARESSGGSESTVSGIIPSGHPVYELINNISSAVASLTASNNLPSGAVGASRDRTHNQSNYTIGWIDAQVMSEGLLASIGRFIAASTYDYMDPSVPYSKRNHSPILPRGGALALCQAMCGLASRSQNRSPLFEAGAPQCMLRLLVDAISRRRKLDFGDIDNDFYPTEELGPKKLQKLQREQDAETAYLRSLSKSCLNMLSFFLADSIATLPAHQPGATSAKAMGHTPPTPTATPAPVESLSSAVEMLTHPRVMDALKYICNQPKGTARLAALRVVSMLVEWPEAREAIYAQRISDILMVIVAESNDSYEYESVHKPSAMERGSSADSARSERTESEEAEDRIVTNENLEVLMRSCYTLAHLCEAKLRYALELFENGLMTIILKTVKHEHVEVQRQAVRCISSMCPVISSLLPGRHPSVVVGKLKMHGMAKMMRTRSDSVNEIRAKTAKLQINVMAFVEALHALGIALTSPSFLVQKEALVGISYLANDDHLRVGIVEGPLRVIINIIVDTNYENELRNLAERVLVNIGFHNGKTDLQVVANDYQQLVDWFYMRRSLRPQALAVDLLQQWIDTLFYGSEVAEKKTKQHFLLAELGREASLDDIDEDSLFLHLPNGVDVDLRDTLDLLGLSVAKTMIERMVKPQYSCGIRRSSLSSAISSINPHSGLREALLQQFSHLFDAWLMLRSGILPEMISNPEHTNAVLTSEIHFDDSVAAPSTLQRSKTGHLTEKFFAFISFCSGRTTAMNILREEETERREMLAAKSMSMSDRHIEDSRKLSADVGMDKMKSEVIRRPSQHHSPESDLDDSLNAPPEKVLELLDLFFPSTLYQMYLMDMFSIGEPLDEPGLDSRGEISSLPGIHAHELSHKYRIPEPRNFRALLLPSRLYLSFGREGKVIQRIISDVASVEAHMSPDQLRSPQAEEASYMGGYVDVTNTLWTLCFRDSTFQGEFMMTLLSTLRRCPQIFSLNFVCRKPEPDSELGYFVGSVPSTIRYISMDNALSSAAIEVMCLMIRKSNSSFTLGQTDVSGDVSVSDTDESVRDGIGIGLQGLAIKNTVMTSVDITHLQQLLDPTEEYLNVMSGKFSEGFTGRESESERIMGSKSVDSGAHLSGAVMYRVYGLKYLDLSENKLSDEYCSNIICACVGGPLEGLELRGNYIHRGLYFCTPLHIYLTSSGCQLRYLGLASNNLVNTTFRSVLDSCQACPTITSIDMSNNLLTTTENNKTKIREFFKKNTHLRCLNLSNNRFTVEMSRAFHLGLLENDSLIILRLDGNLSYNAEEMMRAKKKLKLNRDRYVKGWPIHHAPHTTIKEPASTSATHALAHHNASDANFVGHHLDANVHSSPSTPTFHIAEGPPLAHASTPDPIVGSKHAHTDLPQRHQNRVDSRKTDVAPRQLQYDEPDLTTTPTATAIPITDTSESRNTAAMPVAVAVSNGERDDEDWNDDLVDEAEENTLDGLVPRNMLCVLFSAPLAWTDTRNKLHPIQTLDYASERETLVQVFQEAERDVGLRFDFATTDTLRSAVTMGCKALHFSGHGHPHCLNFEDGRSGLQFVTVDQLRALCQAGGLKLDFVFVSACYSRRAAEAFVDAGVPHVVCVHIDAQLLDAAAMAFTRAFYLALLVGETVGNAFSIGKEAVATSPYVPNSSIEGSKFMLLPEDGDHDKPVFRAKRLRRWSTLKFHGQQDTSHLPRPPEDFEGRETDMHNAIRTLLSRRLVSLVGEAGVGKSAVVVAVCSYMSDRRYFADGIVFVRLQGVLTYEGMLDEVSRAISIGPRKLAKLATTLPSTSALKGGRVEDPIREQEDLLLHILASVKVLLVLDHVNDLLSSSVAGDTSTDLKMFVSRIFDRCRDIKVLTSSTDPIGLGHGFGVVEHCVSIGSLSLRSSLRLFARLSPVLFTAAEKVQFVRALLIPEQADVTLESRELSAAAAQILYMMGGGHPGKIVKMACETNKSNVIAMVERGKKIIGGPSLVATAAPVDQQR